MSTSATISQGIKRAQSSQSRKLQRKSPKDNHTIEIISHKPAVDTPAIVLPPEPEKKVLVFPTPQYSSYNLPKITGELEEEVPKKKHIVQAAPPAGVPRKTLLAVQHQIYKEMFGDY